ncbi:hypothetical protein G7Z17_g10135 [Cylindrodendrum hubeiense]|uniref:Restriction of telomere capping protein 4 n=1 Tax=Cylindrodendrum hubeiense TaxID=595255 RepID=A0A9P5H3M1_9HYPO|nr:hypothetical protein G7Z17_g10135 [Cylindrodendrum hubeiense]
MASGRSGLSVRHQPEPLLRVVGGKQRAKLVQPVALDAAPLSSDDEDEGESGVADRAGNSGPAQSPTRSSDSEPERSSQANIRRTAFGAPNDSKSRKNPTRNASYSRSKASRAEGSRDASSPKSKRRKLDDGESEGPSSKKLSRSISISSSADHLTDEQGFVKKQAVKATYGTKYGSSQESRSKKVTAEKSRQRAKIKAPDSLDSPKKPGQAKLRAPSDSVLSSPSKGPPARFIKHSQDENGDSEDPLDSPVRKPIKPGKRMVQPSKQKKRGTLWEARRPPPARPKFMIPAEIPDGSQESRGDNDGNPKSPLSPLSEISGLSDLSDSEEPGNSQTVTEASYAGEGDRNETRAECPWCGDAVPDALLKEFSNGKRLNVRMQTKFCQTHKKQTAIDTWRERQYPAEILWSDLHSRFEDHRGFLLEVVSGKPSHFRSILANKIETGKARSLKKEDNLNPGYYGPRGFNLMCDYLVGEFGDLLKEKAVSDRVIAGRGSASFIESVLVAELAVRLIQEDMDVSTEEARDIMEESKALGEMIHEEI